MKCFGRPNGLLLALLLAAGGAGAVDLPRPRGLEPDIAFWRRIFSEVSNDEGLVHDDRRLDVVYELIRLPDDHTNAMRRQVAEAATARYADLLAGLAKGNRSGLSGDEKRILALWGTDVDNRTLADAATRVRFQLGQADRFRAGLVRSGLWERYIERTLAEAGVPAELVALPHVESGFDTRARSSVGAAGLWQFMPGTAKDYMRVDAVVDERLDPYRSSEGAARLLRNNYGVTGSWPTAITAYNHGAGGMRRAIQQMGTDDIETIVRRYRGRAFGFASRNFYVSFLAAVEVRANAERYFGKLEREAPDPSVMVRLPEYAPVEALEEVLQVDRSTLERYNPSLRAQVWEGSKYIPRGHRLYLPQRPGLDPAALLAAIPAERWSTAQIADRYHVVRPGESLSIIAPRYGVRMTDLVALNGLRNANSVRVGQRLILPGRAAGNAAGNSAGRAAGSAAERAAENAAAAARAPVVAVRMVAADGAAVAAAPEATPPPPLLPAGPAAAPQPAVVAAKAAPESKPQPDGAPHAVAPPPAVETRSAPVPEAPDFVAAYAVGPGDSIRVQDGESLSRLAEWLGIGVETLLRHNGMSASATIHVGGSLKLPFGVVSRAAFEERRIAYHRAIRDTYLAQHSIDGTLEHRIRQGESAWSLAERRYRIPVWLLREYNPGLDLAEVRPGTRVVIPRISR